MKTEATYGEPISVVVLVSSHPPAVVLTNSGHQRLVQRSAAFRDRSQLRIIVQDSGPTTSHLETLTGGKGGEEQEQLMLVT